MDKGTRKEGDNLLQQPWGLEQGRRLLNPKGKDLFCHFHQNIPFSPLSFIQCNDCQIPAQRNFSGFQAYFYEFLLTLIVSLESLSHVNICSWK